MLSDKQREARRGKLTASRCGCLMRSEPDKIMRLWLELTGQAVEEDISDDWNIIRGNYSEQHNLNRYERKGGLITRRGEVITHPLHDCFACTLDGWIDQLQCPIEAKDVQGREPFEVVLERCQPQLHFQMCCSNTTQCALTVIIGGAEPAVDYIDMDHKYAAELMRRGLQFMKHVREGTPPVILPPAPPPVSKWIDYPMAGNEKWERYALTYLQTKGAADSCQEATKILKSMVPDDARKCFGAGIRITRDRTGRLFLRADIADQVESM